MIEPDIPADCTGLEKVLIGEDRSERPDVVPTKFRVIVTRRPKYAFRGRDGVIQALVTFERTAIVFTALSDGGYALVAGYIGLSLNVVARRPIDRIGGGVLILGGA